MYVYSMQTLKCSVLSGAVCDVLLRMQVNGAEAGEHQLLSHGDKVEVVAAYPPARPAQTGQALNLSHSIPAEARIPPSADQPYSPGRLRRQTAALRN